MPITEESKPQGLGKILFYIRPTAPLWVAALFIAAGLYYFLFADYHVRKTFEYYASNFHGTMVSIGSAHLSLMQGKIELKDIQVAHPTEPTRNRYELQSLEGTFQLKPLLRKQLVFENVYVKGVRYHTSRQGTEEPFTLNPFPGSLPVFEKFSSNLFSSLTVDLSKNPLKHLAQLSTGLHTRELIEERLPRLASTLTTDTVQRELASVEHQVQRALVSEEDLNKLRDTKELVEKSHEKLQSRLKALEEDLLQDTTDIKKSLGLPEGDTESLAPIIFGPRALYFLEEIGRWIEFSRRNMPIKSGPVGKSYVLQERRHGTNVHFPYLAGNPTVVVHKLTVESEENKEQRTGFVKGTVSGLTTDPYILGKPTEGSLSLSFPAQGLSGMKLSFSIDHVGDEPKEHLDIEIDSVELHNTEICKTPDLSLLISKGEAALKVSADFQPHSLKAQGTFKSNGTEFKVTSRYKKIEDYVHGLLLPFYQFELAANVEGPMDALKLDLNSSLDSKLTLGLNDEIKRQLSAVDATIKNELMDHIMPKKHDYLERLEKMKRVDLPQIIQNIQRAREKLATKKTTHNEHRVEQFEQQ